MKPQHVCLSLILASATSTAQLMSTVPESAQAQTAEVKFFCSQAADGVPSTMVKPTSPQEAAVPIIRWTSAYFSKAGYSPTKRCEIVSQKFQDAYTKNPNFVFITSVSKGESVICATSRSGGACETMLYTVKRGVQDPILTLLRLEKVRSGAAGPINESSTTASSVGIKDLIRKLQAQNQPSTTPLGQRQKPKAL